MGFSASSLWFIGYGRAPHNSLCPNSGITNFYGVLESMGYQTYGLKGLLLYSRWGTVESVCYLFFPPLFAFVLRGTSKETSKERKGRESLHQKTEQNRTEQTKTIRSFRAWASDDPTDRIDRSIDSENSNIQHSTSISPRYTRYRHLREGEHWARNRDKGICRKSEQNRTEKNVIEDDMPCVLIPHSSFPTLRRRIEHRTYTVCVTFETQHTVLWRS